MGRQVLLKRLEAAAIYHPMGKYSIFKVGPITPVLTS